MPENKWESQPSEGEEEEKPSRREFMINAGKFAAGAVIAAGTGELARRFGGSESVPTADYQKPTPESIEGKDYSEQVEEAIIAGYGDAYEEMVGPANDKRDGGQRSMGAGLAGGAAMTIAKGLMESSKTKDEESNPIDVVGSKIAPFAVFGGAGLVGGIVEHKLGEAEHDRLYSKYNILMREANDGMAELYAQHALPGQDQQKLISMSRKCLSQIGMENFDPANMASIRESAHQYALYRLKGELSK